MTVEALKEFALECIRAIAARNEADANIIRRRYGLEGQLEETLESVSKDLDCTRERVRQRQNKALLSLNKRYIDVAAKLVEQHVDEVWSQATDSVFIKKASLLGTGRRSDGDLRPALFGEYLLAWDITAGQPRKTQDWLDAFALKIGGAWFDKRISSLKSDSARIAEEAASIKHSLERPISIVSLARQLDSEPRQLRAVFVAAFPKDKWDAHAGYIMRNNFTTRSKRAVQLHHLMASQLGRDVTDIRLLGHSYRERHTDDPCNDRDLNIVIRENPQLFLQVGSGYWAPIGQTSPDFLARQGHETTSIVTPESSSEDETADGKNGHIERIEQLLVERGPQRLGDIYTAFGGNKGAISGIIGMNTRFIRILPGIYALEEHLQSVDLSRDAEKLFNEKEVLGGYVRARFAGESFQLFPLWGWAFEHQLALWADRHKSSLLPELLAVAQPANWPAPVDEIARWEEHKRQSGNYRVTKLPKLKPKVVSAREVLASLLLAAKRGSSSVVSCSLIMKADGIDSSVGSALLMLLVATGAVSCGETWQSPHPVAELAAKWAERLGEELANTGVLDWTSPAAVALLHSINSQPLNEARWFEPSDLELLLKGLNASPAEQQPISIVKAKPEFVPGIITPAESLPSQVTESIITNEELRIAAKAGDPEAMYQLGLRNKNGDGVLRNPMMAVHWLRLAANEGHLEANKAILQLFDSLGRTEQAKPYREKVATLESAAETA